MSSSRQANDVGGGRALLRHMTRPASVLATLGGVFVVWWVFVEWAQPPAIMLPHPIEVLQRLVALMTTDGFTASVVASLRRVALGFLIGSTIGVILGVLVSSNRVLRYALEPQLKFLRYILPFAWVPIAAVVFGLSEAGKLFITAYASAFVVAFQTSESLDRVDEGLLRAGRMLGAQRWRSMVSIRLPYAIPGIATGLRLAMAYSWISLLVAEMVNSTEGIGIELIRATQFADLPSVLAIVLVIGVIGAGFNVVLGAVERRISWVAK